MAAAAPGSESTASVILVFNLKTGEYKFKPLADFFPDSSFTTEPISPEYALIHKPFSFNETTRAGSPPLPMTLDEKTIIDPSNLALGHHPDHPELGHSLLAIGKINKGQVLIYTGQEFSLPSSTADSMSQAAKSELLSHAVSFASDGRELYFVNAKKQGSLARYIQHMPTHATTASALAPQFKYCLRQYTDLTLKRRLCVAVVCQKDIDATAGQPVLLGADYGAHYCWPPGVEPFILKPDFLAAAQRASSPETDIDSDAASSHDSPRSDGATTPFLMGCTQPVATAAKIAETTL